MSKILATIFLITTSLVAANNLSNYFATDDSFYDIIYSQQSPEPVLVFKDQLQSQLSKSVEALCFSEEEINPKNKKTRNVFELFKKVFDRKYRNDSEAALRFEIFAHNLRIVRHSLREFISGRLTFALGVNEFADWDDAELKSLPTLKVPKEIVQGSLFGQTQRLTGEENSTSTTTTKRPNWFEENEFKWEKFPKFADWRLSSCVLKPINQGKCGACYAFATLSVIETMQCIRKRRPARRLSPQQLVDCVSGSETSGCGGGWPGEILNHLARNQSILARNSCYPYEGKDGDCKLDKLLKSRRIIASSCLVNASATNSPIKYRKLHTRNQMMHYISRNGPLIGALEALTSFQRYSQGIYQDDECKEGSIENVNHAVTIIGYGTENGTDYWLIKNSWGTNWGIEGYGKVVRGLNKCSIESVAWTVLN